MISKKELEYIDQYASRVPYAGIKYTEETMERLTKQLNNYNNNYNGKEHTIILSNGEEVKFEILDKNIAHLLGLNQEELNSKYNETFREKVLGLDKTEQLTSYQLLTTIVENKDKIIENEYNYPGKSKLNFYKMRVKSEIFAKFSDFSRFDFGVINFDKTFYTALTGYNFNGSPEKFLYVKSNEAVAPYFLLGAKTAEDGNMISTGLYAPQNPADFFDQQNVCIPTQIITETTDTFEKKISTPSDKMKMLNDYKALIHQYNLYYMMDIQSDYEQLLATLDSKGMVL